MLGPRCHQHGHRMLAVLVRIRATSLSLLSSDGALLCHTGGVPGREAPPEGASPVSLYISNPDMLWANEFPTPRLGQGAFAACVQLLHREARQYSSQDCKT